MVVIFVLNAPFSSDFPDAILCAFIHSFVLQTKPFSGTLYFGLVTHVSILVD